MAGETELVKAAGGDFNLTLIAFLVIAFVGLFVYLIHWITSSSLKQSDRNNAALVEKLSDLIECFNNHDQRMRDLETKLDNRPCLQKK